MTANGTITTLFYQIDEGMSDLPKRTHLKRQLASSIFAAMC
jgi:hypothetical protein